MLLYSQILAVVVIAVCAVMAVFFYSCVRENSTAEEPKLKWYKWFQTINFYTVGDVSSVHRNISIHRGVPVFKVIPGGNSTTTSAS